MSWRPSLAVLLQIVWQVLVAMMRWTNFGGKHDTNPTFTLSHIMVAQLVYIGNAQDNLLSHRRSSCAFEISQVLILALSMHRFFALSGGASKPDVSGQPLF